MHHLRPSLTVIAAPAITFLSAAAAVAVLGPVRWQTGPDLQAERDFAARVSETFMVQSVRDLVGFGPRMGGTPSNHQAAAWLASRFGEWGLEVTVRRDAPTGWYQPTAWEVRALVGGARTDGNLLASAWPRTGSPSASGEGRLSLVAAPGAVWLTSENPSADAVSGSIAVLYDGRPSASGWPGIGRLRGAWSVPVFGISAEEGAALRSRLESGETVRVAFRLEAASGEGEGHTVVATLPGRDRTRHVLFCAHGDSDAGGPGANDNASGAAIVLGIARAVAEAMREGAIPTPPWDMRFAVWGAEIRSTRQYLETMSDDPSALQAVFNFDQSGYGTWKDALYVEPDDVPVNEAVIRLVRQVMSDHLGRPGFPEHAASIKSQGGTDSYVFQPSRNPEATVYPSVTIYTSAWGREQTQPITEGFPPMNWYAGEEAGTVTVDGDAFYHSAGDTPANTTDTEPWNMGWSARVALLSALRLMGGR